MPQSTLTQAILQNLKDAGCDSKTVEQFFILRKAGKQKEQLELLSIHRKQLLDRAHQEEQRINCLDYLIYQIRKEA